MGQPDAACYAPFWLLRSLTQKGAPHAAQVTQALCEKTMKKYMLLFLLFFSTSAFAKDPMCWVKYDFKNNKAPLGIPPGQGSPINLELTPEEVLYAYCKHKCYGFIPDHEEVIGVKSCTLDEVPIDKTKYFNIYKSSINRICKV